MMVMIVMAMGTVCERQRDLKRKTKAKGLHKVSRTEQQQQPKYLSEKKASDEKEKMMVIQETGAGEVEAIAKESSLEAGQCLADVSRAAPVHWQTTIREEDDDDVMPTSALVGVYQWTDPALAALYS